jgi:hypothetical protein
MSSDANQRLLAVLDHFFERLDSGGIFDPVDAADFRRLRDEIADILVQLLVWQRPFLEAQRGLNWPYAAFRARVSFFEMAARQAPNPFIQKQAFLFLARLPFPRQWQWLVRAQEKFGADPEIQTLLKQEAQRIEEKLRKKRQKRYMLRHFCQILKKPRLPEEKGILRIFSLPYVFADPVLLKAINRLYFLYVEPPWGVLFRHAWLRPFSLLADPTLFGLNGEEDAAFAGSQPGILTTALAHADFLEDDPALDFKQQKQFDLIFNATFDDMPRKRHARLLELMQHPLLSRTTALFIGRGQEHNVEEFKRQIHTAGLSSRAAVRDNLLRQDVPALLARGKIGVQISLHENGCRSIYEFLRSDLPCVISTAMAGVNPAIINSRTGIAAPDRDLAPAIAFALEQRESFSPRSWFLAHSGSTNSSRLLNAQLKAIFRERGYGWQTDIVPLASSGASRYVDPAHYKLFRPQFEELLQIFRQQGHLPVPLAVD